MGKSYGKKDFSQKVSESIPALRNASSLLREASHCTAQAVCFRESFLPKLFLSHLDFSENTQG
jgi:hypothetical protein